MWHEYLENNKFLCMLYDVVPDLKKVDIAGVSFIHDGPTINLGLDLSRYADHPPKKWDDSFNTVGLVLEFTDISELMWHGWSIKNIADIQIISQEKKYKISVKSNDMQVTFVASFIDVKNIHGSCRTDRINR